MPEYVYALFDFDPENKDQNALRTGNRIEVIQKDDDDWFEGKNADGRIGCFPKNCVTPKRLALEHVYPTYDFHPAEEDEVSLHAGDLIEVGKKFDRIFGFFPQNHTVPVPQSPNHLYTICDFAPQDEYDIRLHADERIEVLQKDDYSWRGGKLDGPLGLFPPSHTVPAPQNPEYVYAIHDFDPQEEDEIRLHAGDPIEVVHEHDDCSWGTNIDGEFGLFPRDYTSPAPRNLVQSGYNSSTPHAQRIPKKFMSNL